MLASGNQSVPSLLGTLLLSLGTAWQKSEAAEVLMSWNDLLRSKPWHPPHSVTPTR